MQPTRSWPARTIAIALLILVHCPTTRADGPTAEPLSRESLDRRVGEMLRAVYKRGAEDLYNQGSRVEAVYLLEGALEAVEPLLDHHKGLRLNVRKRLATSRNMEPIGQRARELREIYIVVLERVENHLEPVSPPNVASEPRAMPEPPKRTVWDRMGGERGVRVIISEFVDACVDDSKVNFTRGGRYRFTTDQLDQLKEQFVELTSAVTGGPLGYKGRTMKAAHRGMGITNDEFDAAKSHFKIALIRHDVPAADITRLMAIVESTRADVVDRKPPTPVESRSLLQRIGGRVVIDAVVDEFIDGCVADPRVNFNRNGTFPMTPDRVRQVKQHLADLAESIAGGKVAYTGRTMKLAHKGMGITSEEFDAARARLKIALLRHDIDPAAVATIMSAVDGTRADIVEARRDDRPAGPPVPAGEKPPLWVRLGGEEKVKQIISDFVDAAADDPNVNFSRDGKFPMTPDRTAAVKAKIVALASTIFGGPIRYDGRTMKLTHKGMGVTTAEFDALMGHLRASLEKHGIGGEEMRAVLDAVESTRRNVVEEQTGARPVPASSAARPQRTEDRVEQPESDPQQTKDGQGDPGSVVFAVLVGLVLLLLWIIPRVVPR